MKQLLTLFVLCLSLFSFAQKVDKAQLLALKKANDYVYEGNDLIGGEDFVSAEMEYRKAISKQPTSVTGAYNLANAYIKNGNAEEALFRLEQAVKTSDSKEEKYKAFHNIGNVLMQNEKCKEAVEAYKSALRNNPSDDETRYNLAVAKACAEEQKQQEDQNKDDQDKNDENKDDKDKEENEDNKDKEGDNKDDQKDKDEEDKKDGDDKKDEEKKPEDDKKDEGKGDKDKEKEQQPPPKPQPGQLSPQQIKNLLEAMNNQEQEVQEKINAEKQKGVKVKTEKDW